MRRYKPGDRSIPARELNRFSTAADKVLSVAGALPAASGGTVLVKNTTLDPLDRFAVVGINDFAIAPADNLLAFLNSLTLLGRVPLVEDRGRFAVLLSPLPAGAIGQATIGGVAHVKVDVLDEDHKYADIKFDDATQLQSTDRGSARIIVKESGTGTKWATVQLQARHELEQTFVRITGKGTDKDYSFTGPEYTLDDGSVGSFIATGRVFGADLPEISEVNQVNICSGDHYAPVYWQSILDDSGGVHNRPYFYSNIQKDTVFRVALTQTGGSAGDYNAKASWTYTVTLTGGYPTPNLATAVNPESGYFKRPTVGKMVAATHGLAVYEGGFPGSDFKLVWVNEALDMEEATVLVAADPEDSITIATPGKSA